MTNSFVSGSWEVVLSEAVFQQNGLEWVSWSCCELSAQPGARAVEAGGGLQMTGPPCNVCCVHRSRNNVCGGRGGGRVKAFGTVT